MKTLFLLRHAKAENPASGVTDLNRALNERGRGEAQAVGNYLKKHDAKFDLVLCSPAARAKETTALVLAAAGLTASVLYDQRIYEAGPLSLLEVISEIEEEKSAVLLVGHNPGMEELLQSLTGRVEQLATGTLTKIDLDVDNWCSLTQDRAALDWIVKPKELAAS